MVIQFTTITIIDYETKWYMHNENLSRRMRHTKSSWNLSIRRAWHLTVQCGWSPSQKHTELPNHPSRYRNIANFLTHLSISTENTKYSGSMVTPLKRTFYFCRSWMYVALIKKNLPHFFSAEITKSLSGKFCQGCSSFDDLIEVLFISCVDSCDELSPYLLSQMEFGHCKRLAASINFNRCDFFRMEEFNDTYLLSSQLPF